MSTGDRNGGRLHRIVEVYGETDAGASEGGTGETPSPVRALGAAGVVVAVVAAASAGLVALAAGVLGVGLATAVATAPG